MGRSPLLLYNSNAGQVAALSTKVGQVFFSALWQGKERKLGISVRKLRGSRRGTCFTYTESIQEEAIQGAQQGHGYSIRWFIVYSISPQWDVHTYMTDKLYVQELLANFI